MERPSRLLDLVRNKYQPRDDHLPLASAQMAQETRGKQHRRIQSGLPLLRDQANQSLYERRAIHKQRDHGNPVLDTIFGHKILLNFDLGAVFGTDRMVCIKDGIYPGIERANFATSRVAVDKSAPC